MQTVEQDYNWKIEDELDGNEATYLLEKEPPSKEEWKAVTGEETPPTREEFNDEYESAELTARVYLEEGENEVLEPRIRLDVEGELSSGGFKITGSLNLRPGDPRYEKFNEVVSNE
jgi:hypothetical protein